MPRAQSPFHVSLGFLALAVALLLAMAAVPAMAQVPDSGKAGQTLAAADRIRATGVTISLPESAVVKRIADPYSPTLGWLLPGTKVTVYAYENDCYKVTVRDSVRYIPEVFL